MKSGVLTYHREMNKGALLQAVCSVDIIREMPLTDDVEIIDYRPPLIERSFWSSMYNLSPPYPRPHIMIQNYKYSKFLKNNALISDSSLKTGDLAKAKGFVEANGYNHIFVGSDVVWEIRNNSSVPSQPNIFFLPGVDNLIKIAFSVSADRSDIGAIKELEKQYNMKAITDDFDFISYRDRFTRNLLERWGHSSGDIHYLCDPTLLTNLSPFISTTELPSSEGDPLAGIEISNDEAREYVTQTLKEMGYDIYQFWGENRPMKLSCLSIPERLGLYENFDLHITDRFHGSIFGLKIAKAPTIFIERGKDYPNKMSKGRDLFNRLGISESVWRQGKNSFQPDDLNSILEFWKDVNIGLRINPIISESKDTIRKMGSAIEERSNDN